MRYVLSVIVLLCLATVTCGQEQWPAATQLPQPGGIPVYGYTPVEVGRLYPTPYYVPTVYRHYRWRPTLLGRALLGSWNVQHSPGPPMLYVPAGAQ